MFISGENLICQSSRKRLTWYVANKLLVLPFPLSKQDYLSDLINPQILYEERLGFR